MTIDTPVRDVASLLSDATSKTWAMVSGVTGNIIETRGLHAGLGALCSVENLDNTHPRILAEVVSFDGDALKLIAYHDMAGVSRRSRVRLISSRLGCKVGQNLLGRVISPLGEALDSRPLRASSREADYLGCQIPPLERAAIMEPLDVGVRAINALLTMAKGQRLGLIAGSGVGKSTLLGMITKNTEADVVIVGLIGERGREAHDFIENVLGRDGMKRAVIVLATADSTAVMRRRGADLCHTLAEYFRDQGLNVLMLLDSLTRIAHAQREIGLAIGEPPTSKGYPPSVFTWLPALMERGGMGRPGSGSISSIYTVLAEHEHGNDPIVEVARATLDGQIMLSRSLADVSHYPAIDMNGSISRLAQKVISPEDLELASTYRRLWSIYEQNRDILSVGAYKAGSDQDLDTAIDLRGRMVEFAQQDMSDVTDLSTSMRQLRRAISSQ